MGLTKVSTDGVKDDAITSGKIPANAVGASELADNAVDTNAIANNAVTAGKTSGVQTTINNNADNRVITGSGTANTLNGEATLTYNGTDTFELQPASATPAIFIGDSNRSGAGQGLVQYKGNWNGTTVARITMDSGSDTTNKDDGIIRFDTAAAGSVAEAMRIDSSGNVGIGTTSLSDKFTIGDGDLKFYNSDEANNHRTTFIEFQNSSNRITSESNFGSDGSSAYAAGYKFSTKNFNGSAFETLTPFVIQANGRVGIGTTSPDALLHLESNGTSIIRLTDNDTTAEDNQIIGKIEFETRDSNTSGVATEIASLMTDTTAGATALTFKTGTPSTITERMRIDAAGKVMINTTSNALGGVTGNLNIQNTNTNDNTVINCARNTTNNRNQIRFINPNGNVGSITSSGTSSSFNTASDYRLKENEVAISDGITRLKQLKPYKFNFKTDSSTILDGFFAHEVSSIVPEAITGAKDAVVTQPMIDTGEFVEGTLNDPIYQGIDQSKLVPLLTAALQEAIAKIEVLETKVAALEAA